MYSNNGPAAAAKSLQSCPTLCDPMKLQHTRPPCPSPTPEVHSDSCLLSPWCHPAISSSIVPFSSCPQSLQHQSFPKSLLFTGRYQSTGVSASASFPPNKSQGWSSSEWTGWISLQSKGLLPGAILNLSHELLTETQGVVGSKLQC